MQPDHLQREVLGQSPNKLTGNLSLTVFFKWGSNKALVGLSSGSHKALIRISSGSHKARIWLSWGSSIRSFFSYWLFLLIRPLILALIIPLILPTILSLFFASCMSLCHRRYSYMQNHRKRRRRYIYLIFNSTHKSLNGCPTRFIQKTNRPDATKNRSLILSLILSLIPSSFLSSILSSVRSSILSLTLSLIISLIRSWIRASIIALNRSVARSLILVTIR